MTPPTVPVDNSLMVGSVHASDQAVTMPGILTHTSSRAVRAPWWAVLLIVQLLVQSPTAGALAQLLAGSDPAPVALEVLHSQTLS